MFCRLKCVEERDAAFGTRFLELWNQLGRAINHDSDFPDDPLLRHGKGQNGKLCKALHYLCFSQYDVLLNNGSTRTYADRLAAVFSDTTTK